MKPFEYYEPTSVQEVIELLDRFGPSARILAGGTDLVVRMKRGATALDQVVNVKKIGGLDHITADEDGLHIGPLTKLADIADDPLVKLHCPALAEGADTVGTPQVRNLGTLGGNICNASPCADTAPALLVSDARVTLLGKKGSRKVPLAEFFTGPGRTCMGHSEMLVDLFIPFQPEGTRQTYLKLGPRRAADISVVGVAVSLSFDGETCSRARIAMGSVAPTPLRASETEALLEGKAVEQLNPQEAGKKASAEARPISDVRGSEEYRSDMVSTLVERAVGLLIKGD